jgi:hypothetical protein
MSLTKATGGNRLIWNSGDNVVPGLAVSGYTTPAYGDLLKATTTNGSFDHCANGDAPVGIVLSTNSGNGILSVARFVAPVQIMVDYTGSVTVGDKVVSTGSKGTVFTLLDSVKTDNTNGVGRIRSKDAGSPGGTGTCVVEF